ncbi:glycosyltransferase family 2 protein [Yoonia sp. I 8.24]|uniref:glycosyltransferase family 2 protein n=1 Tax=Yoonia sp. I 8.24 TaxID=1537229 RepID=UPI001EE10BA9|nr:glycosyltransferase family 2 protein [Yoonia sp. I 8.24]MCG3268107.1 glycosyltransferase family 2 protein [Yoonia sp. I 8.24]
MADRQSCTLVGTVKDEGPYLLEWIYYYKLIGFDRIAIASNDCSDGTRQMLDYLDTVGEITHLENSGQPKGTSEDPQNRAYERFWADPAITASDWILVADADEFLNIHVGDGTIDALFAALAEISPQRADMISATWRVFGNGGIVGFKDVPVIAQFDQAAPAGTHNIQRYTAFKTMFRPRFVRKPAIHRPRLKPRFQDGSHPVNWVNGSGQPMPERYLKQGWRSFEASLGRDLVSMNHYMIKSSEAFLMKRYRGTANSADQERIDFSYFETFNANDVRETSIQRHVPALQARIDDIKAAHPHLARLHAQSLEWHREKLDTARQAVVAEMPEIAAKLGLD